MSQAELKRKQSVNTWLAVGLILVGIVTLPIYIGFAILPLAICFAFVFFKENEGIDKQLASLEATPYRRGHMPSQPSQEEQTAELWRKVRKLRARSKKGMNVPTELARPLEEGFAPFRAKAAEKVNRQISQGAKIENVEEHIDLLARIEYFEGVLRGCAKHKEYLEKRPAPQRDEIIFPLPRREAIFAYEEASRAWDKADHQAYTQETELGLAQYKRRYANLRREAGIEDGGNT